VARPSFLTVLLRGADRQYSLQNVRSGRVVATRIELALDSRSRRRGLLGRNEFAKGAALIIAPCSSVHTFFMRFAIDVVFVSRDGRVLKTYSTLVPWRMAFSLGAFAVIELPAGAISPSDPQPGDSLQLTTNQT
jgi:uncharacterized membrane protein (UPF0127 family)